MAGLRLAARATAGAIALWGAVQVAGVFFDRRPMALAAIQAAIAQWGADRLGVAWTANDGASAAGLPRRIMVGTLFGTGAAGAVVLLAWATGGAHATLGTTSFGLILLGLVTALLTATRDELVLRGAVLRAAAHLVPAWAGPILCGAVGAAARLGMEGEWSASVVAEGLRAFALATLWMRDRGGWMAWSANASFAWTLGPLSHGGPLEVRFASEAGVSPSALAVLSAGAAWAVAWIRNAPAGPTPIGAPPSGGIGRAP